MTTWGERSLDGAASYVVLLAAGLGFGLAIAPVNTVLLGVTGADVHGSASALAVVARTVGMLAGLSLLTAVALRRFTAAVDGDRHAVPAVPATAPRDCPAYDAATNAAILTQLHTVFAGAAIAAGLAAVAALVLLREVRTPARSVISSRRAAGSTPRSASIFMASPSPSRRSPRAMWPSAMLPTSARPPPAG